MLLACLGVAIPLHAQQNAAPTPNVPAAALTTDAEFVRRIYLDLTGRTPSSDDVRSFLADVSPQKRDKLIEKLLASPEFVEKWTMWLGDLLQNTSTNAGAAVNRGAEGRNNFYRYIRDGRLTASRIGRSYRIRKQSVELLLAATSTRPDIQLRTYTDQQLAEFLEQDQLDAEAAAVVRTWKIIEASMGAHESR